ncbi:hypothetical protein Lepto7375DRAFT_6842 [Leptolyngbya sp. PCC 7375]|nr:hypothetical protein Lepto7375DRAFT_6842 [Leptolyngbya sp. PCC 7375]
MGKYALLIGISEYPDGLTNLPAAVEDVSALQQVLQDKTLGGFDEVKPLINLSAEQMRREIELWYRKLQAKDMALLFFSGHGLKDERRDLYFATNNTEKDREQLVRATAVAARTIHDSIRYSRCKHQIVILDCCFSGAFGDLLAKDDGEVPIQDVLGAEGRVVLTSTSSVGYSFSEEGGEGPSIYTRYLVQGIEKGAADLNGDGWISIGELHEFASGKVQEESPAMSPKIITLKDEGYKLIVARSPQDKPEVKYRKEVEKKARKGKFTIPARRKLNSLRKQYGLAEEVTKAIEEEVLQPYREYQRKLAEYRETLQDCLAAEDKLSWETIVDLKDYQKHLNLKDNDVQSIETELVGQTITLPDENVPKIETRIEEHKSRETSNPAPNFTYKELTQEDISRIFYMKNVKASNGWAYNLEHINEIGGSTDSRVFELFWLASSRGAQAPSPGELIILHQRAKITHIVEILDINAYSNEEGTWRWVRALWMPPSKTDWSQLPHQRDILGFDPPTIVGGATLSFRSKNFSSFWKSWERIELFQNYVWLKLNKQTTLSAQAYQEQQRQPKSQYPTFSFETVRVDDKGNVIETTEGKAECFAEDLGHGLTLEMVRIPSGTFMMGTAEGEQGASGDEYPQHKVTVPEFWMGKFAITQEQWQAVARLKKIERDLETDPANFKGAKRPVEQVSWEDAEEFCKRLSKKTEKEYKLPSEAQWEYACRARTETPFHFGLTITTNLANYRGTDWIVQNKTYPGNYGKGPKGIYREETTEVGSFAIANPFGLYDMHGNVWEWCLDGWHENYKDAPNDGSDWKTSDERKVLRGGSWNDYPDRCRSAYRYRSVLGYYYDPIGFRVVCFPPGHNI